MSLLPQHRAICRRSFLRLAAGTAWGLGVRSRVGAAPLAASCHRPDGADPIHPTDPTDPTPSFDPVLRKAAAYFGSVQSPDGAWRSQCYGHFRDGDSLTPLVLAALHSLPAGLRPAKTLARGHAWLRTLTDDCCGSEIAWPRLRYPLFTAAAAARYFAAADDERRAAQWCRVLFALRHTTELGWPPDDPLNGAWSDTPRPPRRPEAATPPDMLLPNVSATAIALEGLHAAAKLPPDAGRAVEFVRRCRNEPPHGDGGFFFAPNDPIRSKAGTDGTLPDGRTRLRSYGSATADGLRTLLFCGVPASDPAIRSGIAWLRPRLCGMQHPGEWAADRADSGRALAFYWASACASLLASLNASPEHGPWTRSAAGKLGHDLQQRQDADGAWRNPDAESCEDDPLVASAMAITALTHIGSIAVRGGLGR